MRFGGILVPTVFVMLAAGCGNSQAQSTVPDSAICSSFDALVSPLAHSQQEEFTDLRSLAELASKAKSTRLRSEGDALSQGIQGLPAVPKPNVSYAVKDADVISRIGAFCVSKGLTKPGWQYAA